MQLEKRYGGIGSIAVGGTEGFELEQKILGLIRLAAGEKVRCARSDWEQDKREFRQLMDVIFPRLEPRFEPCGTCQTTARQNEYDGVLPPVEGNYKKYDEVLIPVNWRPKEMGYGTELRIIETPGIGDFYMTLGIGTPYDLDCVDDIVRMLGNHHIPRIVGAQSIRPPDDKYPTYGIAEVPFFRAVKALYERAVQLAEEAPKRIGVSRAELNQLHKDGESQSNVALREASERAYWEKLSRLLWNE